MCRGTSTAHAEVAFCHTYMCRVRSARASLIGVRETDAQAHRVRMWCGPHGSRDGGGPRARPLPWQLYLRMGRGDLSRDDRALDRLRARRAARRPLRRGALTPASDRRVRPRHRRRTAGLAMGVAARCRAGSSPRLARRRDRHLLRAGAPARDGLASGRAPRRQRRSGPLGPLHGQPLRGLHRRQYRGHARHVVLADPDALTRATRGVDRHRAHRHRTAGAHTQA